MIGSTDLGLHRPVEPAVIICNWLSADLPLPSAEFILFESVGRWWFWQALYSPGLRGASNCLIALVNLVIDTLDYQGQVQTLRILVELVSQRSSLGLQFFQAGL